MTPFFWTELLVGFDLHFRDPKAEEQKPEGEETNKTE